MWKILDSDLKLPSAEEALPEIIDALNNLDFSDFDIPFL